MKHITAIILLFFISSPFANAQHVDFVNAPMNNVGFKWHKKHFGLKGPVSKYKRLHFNEDGYLIKDYFDYFYDKEDRLISSKSGDTFTVNPRGFLITQSQEGGDIHYIFNDKGLLISRPNHYGSTHNFIYDDKNRVIKMEQLENGISTEDRLYAYSKSEDTLIVEETINRASEPMDITYYYVDGHLTKRTSKERKHLNSVFINELDSFGNLISYEEFTNGVSEDSRHFDISYFLDQDEDMGFAIMESMRKDPNINAKKEYCVSGDCNNGWGKLKSEKVLLIGKFENGKLNGIGRKEYSNGSILEGEFSNNHINGFGLFKNERTNDLFIGNFINGFKSGFGFVIDESYNFTRVGNYSKDVLHEDLLSSDATEKNTNNGICQYDCTDGFGVYVYTNEDSYCGYFKNGAYNGPGILQFNNNVTFGNFTDGKLNGYGIFQSADNTSSYSGMWIDGESNGYGEYISSTKVKTRGVFGPGFKLLKAL